MNAGKKILIGFAVLVGIVILFGAIGKASQDKPRPADDICASGYDALDTDTRFECAKKRHLNAMTGGHPMCMMLCLCRVRVHGSRYGYANKICGGSLMRWKRAKANGISI